MKLLNTSAFPRRSPLVATALPASLLARSLVLDSSMSGTEDQMESLKMDNKYCHRLAWTSDSLVAFCRELVESARKIERVVRPSLPVATRRSGCVTASISVGRWNLAGGIVVNSGSTFPASR